jgi:hypothetical protein
MATLFRSPIFVRLFKRRSKEPDGPTNLLALLAPNPAIPFSERQWLLAVQRRRPRKSDADANQLPLQTPIVVVVPFSEQQWATARPRKKALVDGAVDRLPFLALPFSEQQWATAKPRKKTNVDDAATYLQFMAAPPVSRFPGPLMMGMN